MGRLLLLLLVVLVVLWLLRGRRRAARDAAPPPQPSGPARQPQEMVECRHCGVHLPRTDALPGPDGVYCCDEHRRLHEPGH